MSGSSMVTASGKGAPLAWVTASYLTETSKSKVWPSSVTIWPVPVKLML
ncbi:hypothetical protein LP420_34610 [Massilia sp. B-10]|nr:hypothetical protein LP420_34610 [Massilia sp. B-10]UUZ53664.1 hypothetical protein LP419_34105 [Massilia sp. H-1]